MQEFAEGILASPAWQGIGALAGLAAVAIYVAVEVRRRRRRDDPPGNSRETQQWETFDLSSPEGEDSFYKALTKSIIAAEESIYRSGRGFARPRHERVINDLIRAEETALRNGVEVTRIQSSPSASEKWSKAYADLTERYPEHLRIFAGYSENPLVNVAVIDAYGSSPVIQLLFESHELTAGGPRHRGAAALFLRSQPALAISLQQQFEEHVRILHRMTGDEVRKLANAPIYFAYGSNMSGEQMRERCPSARPLGIAHLYGWRRSFCVPAPHLDGLAAGIQRSDNDGSHVVGVAYEMTVPDQQRLDAIEQGGYRPERVGIKLDGIHKEAYTHVPVSTVPEVPSDVPRAYLDIMITGAEENGLSELAAELRRLGAR
ncbi:MULTISPECIES: gamma-glutamylcyclotransferase family protein [Streptomyces]|uniref:Gamma-glutamylcyclotransferase family protein n=1 Tax=Streptomyces solicathayae TaxID=3081768 RepID=A0ABZ0LTU2_9ACTN|nr:gamma-glutamylcyclotransferase family protein [Streptomyces sp. HUAS YS2]WOX22807.1 gamma-glutamylcyclotransferase family protein [Streptomyces sp. HUAS YS2]